MAIQTDSPTQETNAMEPSLNDFFHAVASEPNPFLTNRINDPAQLQCDVAEIHQDKFDQICAFVDQARLGIGSVGLALMGQAGLGKSHLLARLNHWARANDACYVYLHNLLANPSDLPRFLLCWTVRALVESSPDKRQPSNLIWVVGDALKSVARKAGIAKINDQNKNHAKDAFSQQLLAHSSQAFGVLFEYFFHATKAHIASNREAELRRNRSARHAVRWLSGETLDPDDAQEIGFRLSPQVDSVTGPRRMDEVEDALCTLATLCLAVKRPLILCFDQVDNMGDERVKELSRFLHALMDRARNLLVILCGVKETLEQFRTSQVIAEAAADRLFQNEILLSRITPPQGRKLIESRLESLISRFANVEQIHSRIQRDSLFPFSEAWFQKRSEGRVELRPRDVLTWAKQDFEPFRSECMADRGKEWLANWPHTSQTPTPTPPPVDVSSELGNKLDLYVRDDRSSFDPQHLSECLFELLNAARKHGSDRPSGESSLSAERLTGPSVLVSDPQTPRKTAVAFVGDEHRTKVAARLRQLLAQSQQCDRLLLVRLPNAPNPFGKRGEELRDELQALGRERFREVPFDDDRAADLRAFVRLLSDAAAGDIEIENPGAESKVLSREDVIDTLMKMKRFLENPLLESIFNPTPAPATEKTSPSESNSPDAPIDPTKPQPPTPPAPKVGELFLGTTLQSRQHVSMPQCNLSTHVTVVGAAGSGKTWMAKVLVEEAIRNFIPVLAIDPQGDLVQFLRLSETASPEQKTFEATVETRIWTPGTRHGIPLCLNPVRLPSERELQAIADPLERGEQAETILNSVACNLLSLAGIKSDQRYETLILQVLRRLLDQSASNGTVSQIQAIINGITDPDSIGLANPDQFLGAAARRTLGQKLNAVLHGPAASLFTGGVPLDLNTLCEPTQQGRVPLNVVYLNALPGDSQKHFVVSAIATEVHRWMTATGGNPGRPKLLVYLDEARDYLPAGVSQPPAKQPMLRLFQQARKYGVGCILCTQSPRSVDHNAFSNASTKIIGRLESAQDVDRVREWFSTGGTCPNWIAERKGAEEGTFVARWPEIDPAFEGQVFRSRPLLTLHQGAWPPERVRQELQDNQIRDAFLRSHLDSNNE